MGLFKKSSQPSSAPKPSREDITGWGRDCWGETRSAAREAIDQIRQSGRKPGAVPAPTACASCGRPLGPDEMKIAEATRVIERAMGGASFAGAEALTPNVMSGTAMRCDRCAQWICNTCAVDAALMAQAGSLMHVNCGGFFRNPE